MENMEQRQWDFPDIKQFRSTQADARQPGFPVMWFILMCRQQVLIVDMAQHRESLPWSLQSMNWLKSLRSIRWSFGWKILSGRACSCRLILERRRMPVHLTGVLHTVQIIFTGKKNIRCVIWEMEKCALQVWQSPCRVLASLMWMWVPALWSFLMMEHIICWSVPQIWELDVIRSWHRWRQKCWIANQIRL